ncbi:S66 peptidase family protein [Sphingobacterium thalpophilum]|uniref:Murein tetrapeptide carboxypeptidase n=1 Tax=Sphingobacterium thalpophilum TaxID=259 RepID=A0A4U9US39_9SPHI|nr:LD-carboxypeptidase [Sphingobacterium thalpophilum]VTR35069.1 Murein tetrapeptide carboxypeptidase [Sphingobacterium thalpophilum]
MSRVPAYLQPGDKVAIVCPASFIRGNIDVGIRTLEGWGLEVVVGQTVSTAYHQFAGDDSLRAADLQWALDDPSIKAVFAARGGYGSVRIIDQIDFSAFEKQPKWLVGFSDITVLHSHIQRNYKIATIHGQMPKSFESGTEASLDTLRKALFGDNMDFTYTQSAFPNRPGEATGKLIGGNLAILLSVLGSDSDPKYSNKILFIEDVGEAYYAVDRMLWALKRAGKLRKLKGLIVGGFSSMKDNDPAFGQSVEEIVWDKVKEYDFPVAFGYPAGHIDDNHALILGRKVTLTTTTESVSLQYM